MKRTPLRQVSAKRARENRARRRVADNLCNETFGLGLFGFACIAQWDDGCTFQAEHLHEPLTRARGGSIVDPKNIIPVCFHCHRQIHDHPAEAVERGLLKHSWSEA